MTIAHWSADRLGAMADEWLAEHETFLSAIQTYLATQLPPVVPAQQQPIEALTYATELNAIGERLGAFLQTMDSTPWYTLQQRLAEHQATLEALYGTTVQTAAQRLADLCPPTDALPQHTAVRQALGLVHYILRLYRELQGHFDFATVRFANRVASQIKYLLYPVRHHLPAMAQYWLLAQADPSQCEPAPSQRHARSGIEHYAALDSRGPYTTYVPEYYDADRAWPLLVTLHGGSGNDVDFLWTWLPYAKSRGYLLLSAKSFGPTWYQWDVPSLLCMVDELQARYHIDAQRILLTGLSDGGSFSYEVGFAYPERFAGLAVVAGIWRPHPRSAQASQLPVYIAHGTQDQLFPIEYIRTVAAQLRLLGHDVTFHELANFGHAYPLGENAAILDWFEQRTRAQST